MPVLEEALREATSHPALEARIHIRLAWAARFRKGFAAAFEGTRAALELADHLDDDVLRFEALAQLHVLGAMVGEVESPAYAARMHHLATAVGDARMLREANVLVSGMLSDSGGIDARRAILERAYREWQERDELFSAGVFWSSHGSSCGPGAGSSRRTTPHALATSASSTGSRRTRTTSRARGSPPIAGSSSSPRQESERALKLCEEQIGFHPPMLLAVPGLVALWSGDAVRPPNCSAKADRQAAALGWGAPDTRPWTADYSEALLELGRIEEAVRVIDVWEADARRLGRHRVLAHVMRCRGLALQPAGTVDEAVALLEQAVVRHDEVGDAFGGARALLALGIVLRRARQKRPAREAIQAALGGFEQLGAATWVEKARAELGRIGGRTREEGLTAAERRVAVLVAAGRTNREVAAAAVPRRADRRRPPDPRLRQARRALAHRARAPVALTIRSREQSQDVLTFPAVAGP